MGVIADGISSSCREGGNGGRAVGAGRGRKLGCDCGAGGATSSDCCARATLGADANTTAASITSPIPRPIGFAASNEIRLSQSRLFYIKWTQVRTGSPSYLMEVIAIHASLMC